MARKLGHPKPAFWWFELKLTPNEKPGRFCGPWFDTLGSYRAMDIMLAVSAAHTAVLIKGIPFFFKKMLAFGSTSTTGS